MLLKLEKVCSHLKMRPHKIKIEDKDEIVMYSSIECKGIVGNDSRHYVLDLLRMFPPDLNYLPGKPARKAQTIVKNIDFAYRVYGCGTDTRTRCATAAKSAFLLFNENKTR